MIDHLYCTSASEASLYAALDSSGSEDHPARPAPVVLTSRDLAAHVPDSAVHQGVIAITHPLTNPDPNQLIDDSDQVFILLDQVTDPQNVGAVLRSAAGFGAAGLIMQTRHSPPLDGIVTKAASGALDHVPVILATNLARTMAQMKARGFWCVGLSGSGSATLSDLRLDGSIVLVLGAEGSGMRRLTRERCDRIVRLPTDPSFPVLNVSNAAAIALYEVRCRRPVPET